MYRAIFTVNIHLHNTYCYDYKSWFKLGYFSVYINILAFRYSQGQNEHAKIQVEYVVAV